MRTAASTPPTSAETRTATAAVVGPSTAPIAAASLMSPIPMPRPACRRARRPGAMTAPLAEMRRPSQPAVAVCAASPNPMAGKVNSFGIRRVRTSVQVAAPARITVVPTDQAARGIAAFPVTATRTFRTELRQGGGDVRVDRRDQWTDGADGRDRDDRNEGGENGVFHHVLALLVADEVLQHRHFNYSLLLPDCRGDGVLRRVESGFLGGDV